MSNWNLEIFMREKSQSTQRKPWSKMGIEKKYHLTELENLIF